MVSKNNQYWKQQQDAQRVPHYGLRKLSIGVASVLLSTTLYMGVSAHADTVTAPNEATTVSGDGVTSGASTIRLATSDPKQSGSSTGSEASASPAAATDTNDGAATTGKTSYTTVDNTTFKWTVHYVDADTKAPVAPDTVYTHHYTRTDVDDTIGDWEYKAGDNTVSGTTTDTNMDNVSFTRNQGDGKNTFDHANWQVVPATVKGYDPKYGSLSLTDMLPKYGLHGTVSPMQNAKYTFEYVKQATKVTINYVDDEQGEKVVGTGTVSGKSGSDVTITPSLPSGYMLTPGKDVPSTYTVTDADNQVVMIHVQKQFVDVSATDPQAKQTRTVTLHYVYGAGDKQGQPAFDDAVLNVYYHRTATLDRTTNQTTYGDWLWDQSQGDTSTPGYHVVSGKWTNLPQTWANVTADVPNIKGYYADLGQNDPTNTNHVPSNTWVFPTWNNSAGAGVSQEGAASTAYLDGHVYEASPTHTIKYMPNQTTVTVNYVDDDNNEVKVGSQHWDGTTGQHIDLTLTPPDNYVLTPGWINPSSYDFDGVNDMWYTVHVKHATQDVTAQEPADQVTQVIRLTRNHLYGDGPHKGEKFGEPDIFDLALKRTATKDLVTNKVTFGDWQVDSDNSKNVQGSLHIHPSGIAFGRYSYRVGGSLITDHDDGYSDLGQNTYWDFVTSDGSVISHEGSSYGWSPAEAQKYSVINQYYGPEQVHVALQFVDADTGQVVSDTGWGDAGLTGNDYRDGNTVTLDQTKLTTLPSSLTGYQLVANQTLPTTYKIDTVGNNMQPVQVQVVKERSVKITFVDDDKNGAVVGTPTTITGRTGDKPVALNLTVPDKYELADGQQLPTSYTFTKGSGDVVVHLKHQRNTAQEEKTVTRKVTIVTPDGKSTVTNQTVTFTRNATVDKVTGKATYGSWSENGKHELANVDVPKVAGYTATGNVPSLTVTPDSQDINVTINYTANKQQININYVDISDGNKVVHTTTVNGVTDGDATVPNELPAGYKFVDGQSVPKTVHFNANNNDDINVKVQHVTVTVTSDSPKTPTDKLPDNPTKTYPSGVGHDDLNKTVTRTIKVTTPNGQTKTVNQEVKLTRTADVDEVTGSVKYSDWTTGEWTNYATPSVPGYTASQSNVAQQTVTDSTKDQTVNITYTANPQTTHVNYVDPQGKLVHTSTISGQTDQTVEVPSEVPDGWKLVDGQTVPSEITFGANGHDDVQVKIEHQHVTVTPDQPQTNGTKLPDNPTQSFHGVETSDLNKLVTRTIKVTAPDGKVTTVKQEAKLTRTADVDEVTGEVTYGKWATGQWAKYNVPAMNGYTATQTEVVATPVDETTKDQTVDVSYTPNKQTTTINYVDDKGEVVHTTTVDGVTDQTVKVSSEVPDGWTITKGQVPSEITFGADGHDPIEVTVTHKHVTVTPDKPQANGTKLPDNPTKTFNGVETNDLNKTITRTIKVTTPDDQTKTVEQTTKLTRTADVDEITGEVTYGKWTTGEWSNYDVPTVPGYTPSQNEVPTTKVTADTKDQTVTVTYNADQQKLIVNFIDDTTGQTLKTVNKDGFSNGSANYNTKSDLQNYVNNHYRLVSDDTNGQNLVFDTDDSKTQTYNVHLAHNTHNINDSKTVTETIHYKLDNGQKAFDDHNAQLSFTRTGYNDEVTGQNHWNNWQATNGQTFNAVQSPSKEGYTPDKTSIEAVNVKPGDKNIDITVTYNANAQTAKISYIDDTTGATLKTDNANGKFNQAISFGETPTNVINDLIKRGYKLVSNSFNGQTYQNDNSKNEFTVHLAHNTEHVSKQNTVTRTINYLDNNGKAIQAPTVETVTFTQNGITDLVTGNTTWDTPSSQTFEAVTSPTIKGFSTPDVEVVKPQTVNFNDQNVVVNVHYSKVTTPTNVNNNTGKKINDNTTTPTVDHNKGKLNPTTFKTTPQSVNKPSAQQTVANNSTKANALPQTGNSNNKGTAIIGLGLLSGMLGLLGIKGKKKQD